MTLLVRLSLGVLLFTGWTNCGWAEEPKSDAGAKTSPTTANPGAKPAAAKRANRLAKETSPYLLQHAHNPVDWYPWGPEALEKAKRENKLIFLSIGYSSCHWCHVMERESFLDEEIAALLNKNFVCVKVDREERPDVDAIYMTALRVYNQLARNGQNGGWPISMALTPDAEPCFCASYLPARDGDRGIALGFLSIARRIHEVWTTDAARLRNDAKTITKFVKTELESQRPSVLTKLDASLLDGVQASLTEYFDPKYGGFGYVETDDNRPKFPEPSNLFFLIDRIRRLRAAGKSDAEPTRQLVTTLERMAMGGIRDHLGGGFHRYSVDRFWRIPHFEKMLYDNGQLASVYAEAYQLTGREDFRRVVEELLTFVSREMTDERGGFYSAIDAESEGEEGKYFRWERAAIAKVFSDTEFQLFAPVYGITANPNFDDKYHVPQLSQPLSQLTSARNTDEATLEKQLAPLRSKLLAERSKRVRPLTDTKVLTSWNGLMIRGLADAGRLLKNPQYIATAEKGANFALKEMRSPEGRLRRTFGNGEAKLNAYLDDYAFLVDGLIALHKATADNKWLQAADELTSKQLELFSDKQRGGFFFTSEDHESLLARAKDLTDSAEPSGNAVSAQNLIYLSRMVKKPEYRKAAEQTLSAATGILQNSPAAAPRMAQALAEYLSDQKEDAASKSK